MTCNLRIVSYNCQSFNCNIEFIKQLLETRDVLCLQETLLNDINNVDSLIEYKSTLSDISDVCSSDTYDEITSIKMQSIYRRKLE